MTSRLATFGRLENYQEAAQHNIYVKQQDVVLQKDEVALQVVNSISVDSVWQPKPDAEIK